MPANTQYDAPPIRPGAAPVLDTVASGLNEIAGTQPTFYRMTEALVRWLRYHFSVESHIEYPDLIGRVWLPDQEKSSIQIISKAEWKPTNTGQRPTVLVDRLDQEKDMQHRVIGDKFQGGPPNMYWHLMNGQHVVHCLGGREGEAETLAAEVWRELIRFGPIAMQKLCLMRFLPVKIGKRVQLDEHKETYTIPISIIYSYEESWKITPLDEEEVVAINSIFGVGG